MTERAPDPPTPVPNVTGLVPDVVARLRAAGCVFAEDEAELLVGDAAGPAELAAMVDRRVAGEPLEQVLGWAEFGGLRLVVAPGVFVPRRRTALLAEQATALVRRVRDAGWRPVVVDLCCGVGAIGAVVADALRRDAGPDRGPHVELYATDVDPVAVDCARHNLAPFGAEVFCGDLLTPLPPRLRGRIDVVVANVPHVPTAAIALMPPEARDHEARAALDGGPDGLDVVRRVTGEVPPWLAPGGHLLVEVGGDQAIAVRGALAASGLAVRTVTGDQATVVIGTVPPDHPATPTPPSGPAAAASEAPR